MKRHYEMEFTKLLKSPVLQFEETYFEFCKLLLSKLKNQSVVICYDNEIKLRSIMRYLLSLDIKIEESFYLFDKANPLNMSRDVIDKIREYRKGGKEIICLGSFQGAWWNRKWPRKLSYYTKYKEYYALKDLISQFIYFNPIYFRTRGQEIYEYAKDHRENFIRLFDMLEDELSKEVLYEVLRVAITNGIYTLPQGRQERKYWDCYAHINDECWVNCGSASGDTILKYLVSGYEFNTIYAFEGDCQIYTQLCEVIGELPERIKDRIILTNEYIGTEKSKNNFDALFKDKKVTLINMDIEGAEMSVLRGADEIIKTQRPVLAICAYHKASDLLDIPNYINRTCKDYLFYLRKYIGYEPGALNEYVYYCVPRERSIYFEK